jgi:hypothetical protein
VGRFRKENVGVFASPSAASMPSTPPTLALGTPAALVVAGQQLLAASRSPDGHLCDIAVVVEGLGSLSLPPAASGGPVSKVALPAGARLLDGGKDSVEELATGTFKTHVVAAVVGEEDVLGSARGNADVCNLDEARAEPCGGISADVDALGDKADSV